MERPYYIHVDGMDLAGKTLSIHNFIKSTGIEWQVRKNSLSKQNAIHLLAESLRMEDTYDAEILGNLYVVALMADVRSFEWPEQHTIQDSTIILRSIAYHTVRGTPRIKEVLFDMLPEHPKFDASFVFTANMDARIRRLQKRIGEGVQTISGEDMMVIEKPDKFMAMEAILVDVAKQAFHSVIIDTSTLTPDMVVSEMHRNFKFEK